VNNGGFNQYYFNESHLLTVSAAESLEGIGAPRLAGIVRRADGMYEQVKEALGNLRVSTMEEFMASYKNNLFGEFDDEYYAVSEIERVEELLVAFIRENIGCFGD